MTLHLKTWVVTPGLLQPLSTEGAGFSWSVMCHSHRPRDEEHTISLLACIHLPQAMQDLRRCAPACSHPVCFSCDSCSTCTFACNCVEPKELPRWRESMRVKTQICAIESGKIYYMDLLFLWCSSPLPPVAERGGTEQCCQLASLDLPEIMLVDPSIERNTAHFDCRMYFGLFFCYSLIPNNFLDPAAVQDTTLANTEEWRSCKEGEGSE